MAASVAKNKYVTNVIFFSIAVGSLILGYNFVQSLLKGLTDDTKKKKNRKTLSQNRKEDEDLQVFPEIQSTSQNILSHVKTNKLTVAPQSLSSNILSHVQARVLRGAMLMTTNAVELTRQLETIANYAAFTENQNVMRQVGILPVVVGHLVSQKQAMDHVDGHGAAAQTNGDTRTPGSTPSNGRKCNTALITSITRAVTNLAVNEENQLQLQECIPTLIDFLYVDGLTVDIHLSTLQALTNLSVLSLYHPPYKGVIQTLYQYMNHTTTEDQIQLQTTKLLVNLSANPQMVSHLLAAKAPNSFVDLLIPGSNSDDILLRWVTHLANITTTAHKQQLTNTSLPTQYKAASPETLYTAIYGLNNSVMFRSKLYILTKHPRSDICHHATRIYNSVV